MLVVVWTGTILISIGPAGISDGPVQSLLCYYLIMPFHIFLRCNMNGILQKHK